MKYIPYSEIEDAFSERCFPEQSGLDLNQKKFFMSYFKEAYTEVWNKFDWDFAISLEEKLIENSSQIIELGDLLDAGESRILQVWDSHPFSSPNPRNLSFRIVDGNLFLLKAPKSKSLYIKYKQNVPLVSSEILIPLCFKSMLLSLCVFHWENGQGRSDIAQISLANYERYAQSEIEKQSVASIYGNAINARTRQ